MRHRLLLAGALLSALGACTSLMGPGPDTVVSCNAASDCPGGLVCNNGRCADPNAIDRTPPDVVPESANLSTTHVAAGQSFTLAFEVTEPLDGAPTVSLADVPPRAMDCRQGAGAVWTCSYTATGGENDGLGGDLSIAVHLRDRAGNEATRPSVATVAFDFVPPSPNIANVAYVPAATNPLPAVARAMKGTVVRVAVSASERLSQAVADRPALVARFGAARLEFAIADGGLGESDVVFATTVTLLDPDGAYTLAVTWSDEVGNRGTAEIPGRFVLVKTSSPSLWVDHEALVFVRSPTGNDEDEDLGGYVIPKGPYFAVEPSDVFTTSRTLPATALRLMDGTTPSRVVVQSTADDRALVLGVLSPDETGRFPRQKLVSPDLAGVWLVGVDDAGNSSEPVKLRDAEWVATPALGGFGTAHALWAVRDVRPVRMQPLAVSAPGRGAAGGRDGLGAVARSAVEWEERTPISSAVTPSRERFGVAYDGARGRLVLFGGRQRLNGGLIIVPMDDTWEWDAAQGWTLVAEGGPRAQAEPILAFDAGRNRTVLVDPTARQTWEWDGSTWTLASSTAPASGSLAHDPGRERMVLVGGGTWEWDGSAWTTVSRSGPAGPAAFDESSGRLSVYDGTGLWTWDGQLWGSIAAPGPAVWAGSIMTYDRSRGRLVVDRNPRSTNVADLAWSWNGSAWEALPNTSKVTGPLVYHSAMGVLMAAGSSGDPYVLSSGRWVQVGSNPSPRELHAMSYDSVRARAVLFGGRRGTGLFGDTWEWDGVTWTSVASTGPAAEIYYAMAFDESVGRTVLAGGPSQETWEWDGATWTTAPPVPAPRSDFGMAYDPGRGRLVAHGGTGDVMAARDTWERTGRSWATVSSAGPGVFRNVIVHDATNGVPVMFGGMTSPAMLGSGCIRYWNGSTWISAACAGPSPREYHAMAHDAGVGRVVLFGGYETEGFLSNDDVWEWDGSSWTTVAQSRSPCARLGHKMVFDASRHRLVLFGGRDAHGVMLADTWERDSSPTRQPALQYEASAAAFGIDRARVKQLLVRAYAGGAYAPGRPQDAGATLFGWTSGGTWVPLRSNAAGLAAPAAIPIWTSSSELEARRYLDAVYGFAFQVRPNGSAGSTRHGAAVALDYLEVRARYRVP